MKEQTGAIDPFYALLARLDNDVDRAAQRYNQLRGKLENNFEKWGSRSPHEDADEVLKRVSEKIAAGTEIENLDGFCYGIARNVLMESWRKPKEVEVQPGTVTVDPREKEKDQEAQDERTRRSDCMRQCLARLPIESQWLLREWADPARLGKDPRRHRKELAQSLGVAQQKLINRIDTIRDGLSKCVNNCLKK